ncbi:MAG TPA: glycosyltransferase [Thermoanaerobaculia bacterium]|nr:glycosyltransferase [Thermoanaerobaculia bacterium]
MRAFRKLQERGFRDLALVIVCELRPDEIRLVRELGDRHGVRENLFLTGLISDDELIGLFNRCRAAIHVSRYEGFGLPVLEAMQCGAAVVASRAASLPEIAGEAALLAEPDRPDDIANAVAAILENDDLRSGLRAQGLQRSSLFNGQHLGDQILACYRKAVEQRERTPRSPKLSLWSPMPPQESGVADYSFELIEWIEQHVDLEIVVDRDVTPALERPLRSVFRSADRERVRPARADALVFQFGGSGLHLFEFESLALEPDLVTLHDLTWGRVVRLASRGDEAAFKREIARLEGRDAAREYGAILQLEPTERHAAAESFLTRYFLLGPVIGASRIQVVHFVGGAETLAARYPEADARFMLMGVADTMAAVPFETREPPGRRADDSCLEIGVFGSVDPVKRIERLADAVAALGGEGVNARVRVVGAPSTPEYGDALRRYLQMQGVERSFHLRGRVTRAEFDRAMLESDVVVNLRWPFRQQMSASLMRAIAAGKPVIVTDVEAWRMFPTEFCDYLPAGEGEVEALVRILRGLQVDRDEIERRGAAARRFYREHATLDAMGGKYLELLELSPRESESSRTALPLAPSGVIQVEHRYEQDVAWALEQLVPDAVELEERLRLAGGLGGALAESAVLLALLRKRGSLEGGADVVVLGGVAPRLLGVIEPRCASVGGTSSSRIGCDQGPTDADPPWETGLADGSADVVIVSREIAVHDPEQLIAVVSEALRIVADDGVVLVSFWHRVAGPANHDGGEWSGTLSASDVETVLIESTGGEAVEPFDGTLSPSTRTVQRVIRLDSPTARLRPVEIDSGRVVCGGFVSLRRPTGWRRAEIGRGRLGEWKRDWIKHSRSEDLLRAESPADESAEPGEAASWGDSDLRQLLFRWNQVRARSGLELASSGNFLSRAGGFLRRTARRIRDLGIAWDRLRDLLVALVHRQQVLDEQQRLVRDELYRLRDELSQFERRLDQREEKETLRGLEANESKRSRGNSAAVGEIATAWLSPPEMSELLRELEELEPGLRTWGSIELSFARAWSEDLLEIALRRFGDRIASVTASGYRSPNDAWIVVDLGSVWPSAALLRCARWRLAPGGVLLLITRAGDAPPTVEGVQQGADVPSRALGGARIVCWRRGGEHG